MAAVKQPSLPSRSTFVQSRHRGLQESEALSAWQPLSLHAQAQPHHPAPPLQQRPLLCRPAPSMPITATTDPVPGPSMSKSRNTHSSAMAVYVIRIMETLQFPIEADTYAALLQDCARTGDLLQGAAVHAHIRRRFSTGRSLLRQPAMIGLTNRLLLMYASCGRAADARQLFDDAPVRDSRSMIITMSALSGEKGDLEALRFFVSMHSGREGWWAEDPAGFRIALRACAQAGECSLGQQLHGLAVKFTGRSFFSEQSAPLIYFYAKLGCPDLSLQLMTSASPSSQTEESTWAYIVSAYCKDGCFRKAFMAFNEMGRRRTRRQIGHYKMRKRCKMLASILAVCAAKGGYLEGCQIHAHAMKVGADEDGFVGCSLIELYSKSGNLVEARRVFETVTEEGRDAACWNAMLSGYARGGTDKEKLLFLQEMKAVDIKPIEAIMNHVW